MKCKIIHESRGRLHVHLECARMSLDEADVLEYYMRSVDGVDEVKVYDRTRDAVICYRAERAAVINALAAFSFSAAEAIQLVPEHTTRELNREFEDKLAMAVLRRTASKLFLPVPVTTAIAIVRSLKYIHEGLKALLHGRLSVAVLDATAVSVSMLRGDFSTASSVMFMLSLGEILEEWTHKKSVADLAGAMSINIDKAWLRTGETETLVPVGDEIVIRTGCMIPLDGKVIMIGDGVNDSPALSEADAGIAIATGAAIAREIADITISSEDLFELVTLRRLSEALMDRIHRNYRFIVGFNCSLIALGVAGILPPATSALLHNLSTLAVSMKSMTNLLPEEEE